MSGRPENRRPFPQWLRPLLALVFLSCAAVLAAYALDWFREEDTAARLREAVDPAPPADTAAEGGRVRDFIPVTPLPEGVTEVKEGMDIPVTVAPATLPPAVTARPAGDRLEAAGYPAGPDGALSALFSVRISALREKNPDIIGWLTLDGALDTAVVQRDNVRYLTHDALGERNVNGAVFLDEGISLGTRPYTLILYGHNMKTGAMFGCLRNYESLSFLREHPLIRFSTLYEEGVYAVAAVASISLEKGAWNALDLSRLDSATVSWRRAEIEKALSLSMYTAAVDVEPTDQVLVLMTCTGDDSVRRMVLARRLRDGETEAQLAAMVGLSEKK